MRKIAAVFDITVDELIGDENAVDPYFFDNETANIAQNIKKNAELKTLFDECHELSDAELKTIIGIIKMLKNKNVE